MDAETKQDGDHDLSSTSNARPEGSLDQSVASGITDFGKLQFSRSGNRAYTDVKELRALGRTDEAAKLAKGKGNMLQLRQMANRAQRNLTQVNNRIKNIRRSDLSAEQKRIEIDRLNA